MTFNLVRESNTTSAYTDHVTFDLLLLNVDLSTNFVPEEL